MFNGKQSDYKIMTYITIFIVGAIFAILVHMCLSPENFQQYDDDGERRVRRNRRNIDSRKQSLEDQIVIRQITRPKNPTGSNDPSSSMRDSIKSHASQSERVYASFLSASLRSSGKGSIELSQPITPDDIDIEQGGVNDSICSNTSSSSTNKSRRTCNYVARQISSKLGNLDDTCGICLMEYEDGEHVGCSHNSECEHHFHKDCILNWLARDNSTCPVCRRDFLKKSDKAET